MDKTYNPHAIEGKWYEHWEKSGYFAPREPQQGDEVGYCIMIPPPNVTGSLHMGHAFQTVIMDALIRYQRMCGRPTLWQVGTDHAGIATQMVVEQQLRQQNQTRHQLGREAFVERVWEWKRQSGNTITRQLRRMGASTDWGRERFTMDEGLSEAVTEVFTRLYDEGLIYRGKRLVNWDPVLHTAISDLEVEPREKEGSLWYMRYPVAGAGDEHIVVATTRPETMLGDTAVAVNPKDDRYSHLVGKYLILPLANRRIPVVADHHVDPEFGTGCVKVTPAHDFNDYAIGIRHNLPMINIFTENATLNESAPLPYRGMDRYQARKQVIEDLQARNLLEKIEPHKMMIPYGQRSGVVVEPYLTDQWFVRIEPLAKPAIEAVEKGRIRFVPEKYVNMYNDWMNNIQDWCISRQLWWGHRIPAWYDEQGQIYVGRDEQAVREKHNIAADVSLSQDEDVLDTWFSSALWPFSTLGWPESTPELKQFYPTSVLVTGFDIIFFWVARMIMMGLKFAGDVPFRDVYIHGLVRDSNGEKMSKSKGNVIDPLDLIDGIELDSLLKKRTSGLMLEKQAEKITAQTRKDFPEGILSYGTDSLRFTFAAMASTARDINFDMKRIEGYRNFCNKLWNAARYVLMNCEGKPINDQPMTFTVADQWIWSRLQATIDLTRQCIQQYRFDHFSQALYDFTWNEYCDWYLELSKPVLQDGSEQQKNATRFTLVHVLENLLRLAHPLIPFITEEIWQKIGRLAGRRSDSIMIESYPEVDTSRVSDEAENELDWIMQFILGIRKIRSSRDLPPNRALPVLLQNAGDSDLDRLEKYRAYITTLAKLENVAVDEQADTSQCAAELLGSMKILVPLSGLFDVDAETQKLQKQIDKLNEQLKKTDAKLSNPNFVDRAPADVVEKERQRMREFQSAIEKLSEQLAQMGSLNTQ